MTKRLGICWQAAGTLPSGRPSVYCILYSCPRREVSLCRRLNYKNPEVRKKQCIYKFCLCLSTFFLSVTYYAYHFPSLSLLIYFFILFIHLLLSKLSSPPVQNKGNFSTSREQKPHKQINPSKEKCATVSLTI